MSLSFITSSYAIDASVKPQKSPIESDILGKPIAISPSKKNVQIWLVKDNILNNEYTKKDIYSSKQGLIVDNLAFEKIAKDKSSIKVYEKTIDFDKLSESNNVYLELMQRESGNGCYVMSAVNRSIKMLESKDVVNTNGAPFNSFSEDIEYNYSRLDGLYIVNMLKYKNQIRISVNKTLLSDFIKNDLSSYKQYIDNKYKFNNELDSDPIYYTYNQSSSSFVSNTVINTEVNQASFIVDNYIDYDNFINNLKLNKQCSKKIDVINSKNINLMKQFMQNKSFIGNSPFKELKNNSSLIIHIE